MTDTRNSNSRYREAPAEYLRAMVRRLPPVGAPVVPNSTPVVAFGDPARAKVATLGINPSVNEFMKDGSLLVGNERRLATLQSLGAQRTELLTDAQVSAVVEDCVAYFNRRPYRRWFDPLDQLLRLGAGASYYDGSACHLDLVQWATDPIWARIADSHVRQALLDDGVPHLRAQMAQENFRQVLLNGRQVLNQVLALGLADLEEVGRLALGGGNCSLYQGSGAGIEWAGWSANLQSGWGISSVFKQELAAWLARTCTLPTQSTAVAISIHSPAPDAAAHLPQGMRIRSKTELVNVLRRWLRESRCQTIGDVGTFGGRPWLLIDLGVHEVALNADTKRTAVERFVRESTPNPEQAWRVVANRRRRVNKVLPSPGREPLPGWFAYLTRPLDSEGII